MAIFTAFDGGLMRLRQVALSEHSSNMNRWVCDAGYPHFRSAVASFQDPSWPARRPVSVSAVRAGSRTICAFRLRRSKTATGVRAPIRSGRSGHRSRSCFRSRASLHSKSLRSCSTRSARKLCPMQTAEHLRVGSPSGGHRLPCAQQSGARRALFLGQPSAGQRGYVHFLYLAD